MVVLPEPLGPITQTTSPGAISRSTPFSTCKIAIAFVQVPDGNHGVRIGCEVLAHRATPKRYRWATQDANAGDREANDEVDRGRGNVERQDIARSFDDLARGEEELAHAQQRGEGCALDQLGGGIGPGRNDHRHRLRQAHMEEPRPEGEPERLGGVCLPPGPTESAPRKTSPTCAAPNALKPIAAVWNRPTLVGT